MPNACLCAHETFTRPRLVNVQIPTSQHVIGEAEVQRCLTCGLTRGQVRTVGLNAIGPFPYTSLESETCRAAWHALLPHLTPHHIFEVIVMLRFYEGREEASIAEVLGLSVDAVKITTSTDEGYLDVNVTRESIPSQRKGDLPLMRRDHPRIELDGCDVHENGGFSFLYSVNKPYGHGGGRGGRRRDRSLRR